MKTHDYFELYAKADLIESLISYVNNDLSNIMCDEKIKQSSFHGDLEHICLQLWSVREVANVLAERLKHLDSAIKTPESAA